MALQFITLKFFYVVLSTFNRHRVKFRLIEVVLSIYLNLNSEWGVKCKNSQIYSFDKFKWFLPCLLFTFLLPDLKENKGKGTPCERVGTHLTTFTENVVPH